MEAKAVESNVNFDNLNILVVDDQEHILDLIQTKMELEFPDSKIKTACDGQEAIKLISEKFIPSVIITDLKMPKMNGIKLAKEVLKINPTIPIILHSAYMDVLDLIENIEIGFQGFLEKPVTLEEIAVEVKRTLSKSKKSHEGHILYDIERLAKKKTYPFDMYVKLGASKFIHVFKKDEILNKEKYLEFKKKGVVNLYIKSTDFLKLDASLYTPIRTSTLMKNKVIEFSIFIRNKKLSFDELLKTGLNLTNAHLDILKERKIEQLFILEEAEPKYQKYLDQVISEVVDSPTVKEEEKAEIIGHYSCIHIEDAYNNPDEPRTMKQLQRVSSLLDKFLAKTTNLGGSCLLTLQKDNSIYEHVLRVCTLSLLIIKIIVKMRKNPKLNSKVKIFENQIDDKASTLEVLSIAAILHDLGKVPLELKGCVNLDDMGVIEIKKYMEHVDKTVEMLSDKLMFPPKMVEIIKQHHEYADGTGYPYKLLRRQTSILAQVLSLANYYDNLIAVNKSVDDAVSQVEQNKAKFNKHLIPILKIVVNLKRSVKE